MNEALIIFFATLLTCSFSITEDESREMSNGRTVVDELRRGESPRFQRFHQVMRIHFPFRVEKKIILIVIVFTNNVSIANRHIEVTTGPGQSFVFTIKSHREVAPLSIGFSLLQRKWATLSLGQDIDVRPFQFDANQHTLANIVLEADFLQKKR